MSEHRPTTDTTLVGHVPAICVLCGGPVAWWYRFLEDSSPVIVVVPCLCPTERKEAAMPETAQART